MTETTRTDPPLEAAPGPVLALLPTDILTSLIITFLAPLFLAASGGDIGFASMAALQTVKSYRTRTLADLIAAAQIVAYGLAALGSLSLSMDDGLSLPMILRLRGNANACTRSAEHNRRALGKSPAEDRTFHQAGPTRADAQYEAEVMTNLAETKKRTAETMTRLQPAAVAHPAATPIAHPAAATIAHPAVAAISHPAAAPIAHPAAAAIAAPVLTLEDRQRQAAWADAMTDVAAEFTAGMADLSPAERREASHRAALLTSCANELLSGTVPPRFSPGDLDALIHPNPVRRNQESPHREP